MSATIDPSSQFEDNQTVEASSPSQCEATQSLTAESPLTFADLGLEQSIQMAVMQSGYIHPTEVQARIIPHILEGRDVLAQSQTGTGKTAAFALPILSRIEVGKKLPQVLVLTPTRELALQVSEAFEKYGAFLHRLRIVSIYGGSDYNPQLRALKEGVDIVIGTPGRVIDHLERGTLSLEGLNCLVLDEADEMLSMGFQEDVERVLQSAPEKRQIALFSATMPAPIREIADTYLVDPATVLIGRKTLTAESIEQRCVFVPDRFKMELLTRVLELEQTDGVIVFTKTKESTVQVAERLVKLGFSAAALNGDLPQVRRQRTVDELKSGRLNIVVATDVAARGLDVQRISHVINYDLPHDGEAYVHRIGRTGRAGRTGVAYIFLTPIQSRKLRIIERLTKQPIQVVDFPTAKQLNQKRIERFKEQLKHTIETEDLAAFHKIVTEFAFDKDIDLITIAAALAHQARRGQPLFAKEIDFEQPRSPKSRDKSGPFRENSRFDRKSGKGRGFGDRHSGFAEHSDRGARGEHRNGGRSKFAGKREEFSSEFSGRDGQRGNKGGKRKGSGRGAENLQCFQLAVGAQDGVRPGNIVGAIANESGISGREIGPIDIRRNFTLVQLPGNISQDALQILRNTWVAGKQLKIRPYQP